MPLYDAKKKDTKTKIPSNFLQPQHLAGSPGDSQTEGQFELHTHSLFLKGKGVWRPTPIIPAVGRQRAADPCESQDGVVYTVSSGPCRVKE